jgi:luciferase family oxidoreductase group 1
MSIKLSVVDQSPVHASHPAAEAPSLSVQLAIACDQLGYSRYWLAEHHDSIHFANPCPEILVARIASATSHLRVGSGGVMLSHYSPYKVAECFRMLETLFPGRIDLGVGRAPGGSNLTTEALASPYQASYGDQYPQQARDLQRFIEGTMPEVNAYHALRVLPDDSPKPELWMLGSSGGSAGLAGHLGYGIALARFIAGEHCSPAIFDRHLEEWNKAGHLGPPPRMLAIACICGETEAEAKLIAGTAVYRKLMAGQNSRQPFLSPGEVQDQYRKLSPSLQDEYQQILNAYTVGTAEQCWEEMTLLGEQYQTNEIGLVSVTYGFEERLNSHRLLAKGLC